MRIGELASQADVNVETVRFYERKGLIEQPLKPANGGYRSYSQCAVERIRFIRSAQNLGFSLNEIAELLALEASQNSQCEAVRGRAKRKREQVQGKIAELQRISNALDALIGACPGKGPLKNCSILDALGGKPSVPILKT